MHHSDPQRLFDRPDLTGRSTSRLHGHWGPASQGWDQVGRQSGSRLEKRRNEVEDGLQDRRLSRIGVNRSYEPGSLQ